MFKKKALSSSRVAKICKKGMLDNILDFTETGANDTTLRMIRDELQSYAPTQFTTLEMYGNNLGDEGLHTLKELVDSYTALVNIKLQFNNITSDGVKILTNWLGSNRNIKRLNLYENRKIGDAGAAAIADLIKAGTSLEYLNLYGCGISNEGAKLIAKALLESKSKLKINLNANDVDESYLHAVDSISKNQEEAEEERERVPAPVSNVRRVPTHQPQPRLDCGEYTIARSNNVHEYEKERAFLIKTLEKLMHENRMNIIALNKESQHVAVESPVRFLKEPMKHESSPMLTSPQGGQEETEEMVIIEA